MDEPYTVKVSAGQELTCRERIELEVRLARELERHLGGPHAVAGAYRASLIASQVDGDAQRWADAFANAVQTVCGQAAVAGLQFRVNVPGARLASL